MSETTSNHERAAAPVIGVILMVAIAVVLAAVVGIFALDLGTGTEEAVQAGASVNAADGNVIVTYVSTQEDATTIDVTVDGTDEGSLATVGETKRISGYTGTVQVVVTATNDDGQAVIYNDKVTVS